MLYNVISLFLAFLVGMIFGVMTIVIIALQYGKKEREDGSEKKERV